MYNHNKAQQSKKPCAYFLGYTVLGMACQCLVQYTHIMIKALLTFKILSTSISSEHYDTCISTFATRDQASHLPHNRDLLFVKFCKTNENNYFHWSAVILHQIATLNNLKQIFYTYTFLCKFMQQLQLAVKISEKKKKKKDIWIFLMAWIWCALKTLRRRIWSIRPCKSRVAMSGQSKFWRCQSGADCDWWKHGDATH